MKQEQKKAVGIAVLLWGMLAAVFTLLPGGMGTAEIEIGRAHV